jgi:2-methylcitrate dehydratase PrpD
VVVRLPPYAHRLVGHDFSIGRNARVNAQFSAQFCVANAFVRRAAKLAHFRENAIRDPEVLGLIDRIKVVSDASLDARGHTAVDLSVATTDGRTHVRRLDSAPGNPGRPLTDAEHLAHFDECMDYAEIPLPRHQAKQLAAMIEALEGEEDVQSLVRLLVTPGC